MLWRINCFYEHNESQWGPNTWNPKKKGVGPNDDRMLALWLTVLPTCVYLCGCQFTKLYVGPSAASNARTMFTRGGVNYCSLTHHIISLCLDLLPYSLEIQPALSTDTERESHSSIFSALCLPCAMFFGTLPPLHTHSRKKTLLQMLPIFHW